MDASVVYTLPDHGMLQVIINYEAHNICMCVMYCTCMRTFSFKQLCEHCTGRGWWCQTHKGSDLTPCLHVILVPCVSNIAHQTLKTSESRLYNRSGEGDGGRMNKTSVMRRNYENIATWNKWHVTCAENVCNTIRAHIKQKFCVSKGMQRLLCLYSNNRWGAVWCQRMVGRTSTRASIEYLMQDMRCSYGIAGC